MQPFKKLRDGSYDFLNAESRSRTIEYVARTGRPREFDKEQALERALKLFWSRGYGATSIQDLVDALAVERGSLYGTFGDKRRFYLEAVRLYWEVYERHLTTTLDAAPLLPALREILTHPARLDELISDVGVPQGCLVGNTTAELVPQDSEATEIVTRSYHRFTAIVTDASGRAQAAGEVTGKARPEDQAQMLLYLVQGLSLVSRAGLDLGRGTAGIDVARRAAGVTEPGTGTRPPVVRDRAAHGRHRLRRSAASPGGPPGLPAGPAILVRPGFDQGQHGVRRYTGVAGLDGPHDGRGDPAARLPPRRGSAC
ncbi:hypothetical protein STENM36S_03371 [Streptomyces tendae]